jgi:hypothetical protein
MRYLPLLALFLLACFREPEGAASSPLELHVSDLAGVDAVPAQAPRDVELSLSFIAPPDELEPALLHGRCEPVLVQRLSFSKPGAALAAQLVALQVERAPHALRVRPQQPLAPGRYTLVWPYGPEPRSFALTVSASPALGARWLESAPSEGASVPSNLARALMRFDGHVRGDLAAAVHLRQGADVPATVSLERCSAYGLPEGDCVWVAPGGPLAPGRHELMLDGTLETPGGAPIAAAQVSFEVRAEPDRLPPTLVVVRCASDERALGGTCIYSDDHSLVVRGGSSEPVLASLLLEGGLQRAMALSYAGDFTLALSPREAQGTATLRTSDLAGNVSELSLSFELQRGLAQLSIDEVRADPLGKEPAQEYVELLNFGTESVSLMGFSLSTDVFENGRAVASSAVLAPGERALLVGPDFDPRDLDDGVLPGAARVVPLSGALSLPNAGGKLWLRDARGRRVASALVREPLVEGQCTRHIGSDFRSGKPEAWELDARGGCSPGVESEDAEP